MMGTVSNVTAANGVKPVLSYAKQGARKVPIPVNEEQQGQAEVHAVSKSSGRPPFKGSAKGLPAHVGTCPILGVGQEVQKEEVLPAASIGRSHDRVAERGPYVKVNHSSLLTSSNDELTSSLKSGIPMCGPTPVPRVRSSLNPAAEEFVPRPPGVFNWGLAWVQSSLQQACYPLQACLQLLGCLGVEPWLCTPWFGPALG